MKLIDVTRKFATEDPCLDYIEQMRWPQGAGCVHCGSMSVSTITRKAGKNKRVRIYQCLEKECGKQFSATSGTIFNDTHLPLTKWFMALALICEADRAASRGELPYCLASVPQNQSGHARRRVAHGRSRGR